jgi:hypothetical protein
MSIALSQPTNMTLLRSLVSCFYSLLTLGIAGARNANQFSSLPRKKPVTRFKSSWRLLCQFAALNSSLFILHSSLFTLHGAFCAISLRSTFHSSLFTLHSSLFILHSSLFILHSSLFTLHSSLFTLHSPFFTEKSCYAVLFLIAQEHISKRTLEIVLR